MRNSSQMSLLLLCVALSNTLSATLSSIIGFHENKGQVYDQNGKSRPDVLFAATTQQFSMHLRQTGVSYQFFKTLSVEKDLQTSHIRHSFSTHANAMARSMLIERIDIEWLGCNTNAIVAGDIQKDGYENYYQANCPSGALFVREFEQVNYRNLYTGVNLKWYNSSKGLKYDFELEQGAKLRSIILKISGASNIYVDRNGDLVVAGTIDTLREARPIVFQNNREIAARWIVNGNLVSFVTNEINEELPLIVDPLIRSWGTLYGGTSNDEVFYVNTDSRNNVLASGQTLSTFSLNLATTGAHQVSYGGSSSGVFPGDAFLVKFNGSGSRMWATYYGGTGNDFGNICVADTLENVYLAGGTTSTNNAVIATNGAFQTSYGGHNLSHIIGDGFLAKFNSAGIRQWGTYFGDANNDWVLGLCVDNNQDVYISGGTMGVAGSNVLASNGAHQALHSVASGQNCDAFLAKFSGQGQRLWSTYYGDVVNIENGHSCGIDSQNNVYMNLPAGPSTGQIIATTGSYQSNFGGGSGPSGDAAIVKFNQNGTRLWGTYYGGTGNDDPMTLLVTLQDQIVLFGQTSSPNATVFASIGAQQSSFAGGTDCFVAKFSSSGFRIWGTYYGGTGSEYAGISTADALGNIYLVGTTSSALGTAISTCAYQTSIGGGVDGFIAKIDSVGQRQWGTFLGGPGSEYDICSNCDKTGALIVGGAFNLAGSASVFTTTAAFQTNYSGSLEGFIEKFTSCQPATPVLTNGPNFCKNQMAVISASQGCGLAWYSDANLTNLVYAGSSFTINNLSSDTVFYVIDKSCGLASTAATAQVLAGLTPTINILTSSMPVCAGNTIAMLPGGATTFTWTGFASTFSIIVTPTVSTTYTVKGKLSNNCIGTATVQAQVSPCVNIKELHSDDFEFAFYPNPLSTELFIKAKTFVKLFLVDLSGRQMLAFELNESEDFQRISLNLKSGLYFLEANFSDGTKSCSKLVISN